MLRRSLPGKIQQDIRLPTIPDDLCPHLNECQLVPHWLDTAQKKFWLHACPSCAETKILLQRYFILLLQDFDDGLD